MKKFAKEIQTLTKYYTRKQVAELLNYLSGTILKGYDDEEQEECLIDNCQEFERNPNSFIQ